MIQVRTMLELGGHVGHDLPPSGWVTVTQSMIDAFAEATGDRNWYHTDVERAARELPGGRTIAHGVMTLAMLPDLTSQIIKVTEHGRALNYGYDSVRFPAPVQAGDRIRLQLRIADASEAKGGRLIRLNYTVEIEGETKPALVAEGLLLAFPPGG